MGYDPSKDRVLAEKQVQVGKEAYKIGLYPYNGGAVKAGIINVQVLTKNGYGRVKAVGRMTAEVLKTFVSTINELKGQMVAVPQPNQAYMAEPQRIPMPMPPQQPTVITPAPTAPMFTF